MITNSGMNLICGFKIVEDPYMLMDGEPIEVKLSIWERLKPRFWFKTTKTIIPRVPMQSFYQLPDGIIVCHPSAAVHIRTWIKENGGYYEN